jgi:serralysin
VDGSFASPLAGNDTIDAGGGNDNMYGDAYYMDGGYAGSDNIQGGAGDDSIFADPIAWDSISNNIPVGGNDTVNGGSGNDTLFGGPGDDTFVFGRRSGIDTIYDFNSSNPGTEHDQIDLTAYHLSWSQLSGKFNQNDNDVTVIQLTSADSIVVHHSGVGPLTETDFIL